MERITFNLLTTGNGIRVDRICECLHIGKETFMDWTCGKAEPSEEQCRILAELCNCSVATIHIAVANAKAGLWEANEILVRFCMEAENERRMAERARMEADPNYIKQKKRKDFRRNCIELIIKIVVCASVSVLTVLYLRANGWG